MKKLITLLILLPALAIAGGLYQQQTASITGEVITYLRSPRIEITNPLDGPPAMMFVTESVTLIPGQEPIVKFIRRVYLNEQPDSSRVIPYLNPATGEQIGTISPAQVYAMLYSLWIAAEMDANKPATMSYVTNGNTVISQ